MSVQNDQAQISEVLIRYATGIDTKDWPLFRSCWTDDAVGDYDQLGTVSGAEALTDVMMRLHDGMGLTYHRLSNFVIDVDGDQATVCSYVHAVLMASPDDPDNWFDAIGHYNDIFVRTGDGWRISRRISRTARLLSGGDKAAAALEVRGDTQ